jgi:glycine betaine/proline transport system substrate-binding protein
MRKSTSVLLAGLAASGLVLAGCGDDGGNENTGSGAGDSADAQTIGAVETGQCDPAEGDAEIADPEGTGDDDTAITIGVFSGWDENYVVAELAKVALEEQGYTVEFEELEAGPAYTGAAQGDIDLLMDAWLPNTHASYVEQFGDDLEDVGCWFDEGFLTIAVNADSPAQSLDELTDQADAYGSRLVGIEPGAGLTATTQDEVIPTYGLEDWEFPTSSSPAMLAELDAATQAGENIAVTLWHPHWAYAAYDIRDLEDPEGALGEAERLYSLGRPGFHEDFPNAAQLIQNLYLSNDQLLEIEDIMVVQNDREDNPGAVAQWLEANPDFLENWRAGSLA